MTVATKYRTSQLKDEIDANGKRIYRLEKSDILQDERINKLRKDTDDHTKTIKALENFSIEFGVKVNQAIGIARWVLLGFGVYIIALLWQLLTGQVFLQFP